MNSTASLALKLVPNQFVFLFIDDTMVSKFGNIFEPVSKFFYIAPHHSSNYLNGHCFVSLMLYVPVWIGRKIVYQSEPLGYRMYQKKETKTGTCRFHGPSGHVQTAFREKRDLLCDIQYAKKNLVRIVDKYPNLGVVCNARFDSVMYNPPLEITRKKGGQPAKHGHCLSAVNDFNLSDQKVGNYHTDINHVPTKLFGDMVVLAYVIPTGKTEES